MSEVWISAGEAMGLLGIKKISFYVNHLPKLRSKPGAKKANGKYERLIALGSLSEEAQLKYLETRRNNYELRIMNYELKDKEISGKDDKNNYELRITNYELKDKDVSRGGAEAQRELAISEKLIVNSEELKIGKQINNIGLEKLPEFARVEALRRYKIIVGWEKIMEEMTLMKYSEQKKYSKTKIMEKYAEKNGTDEKTLYRWISIFEKSKRNIGALAPKYGELAERKELIIDEHWKYFLSYYLTPNQLSFEKCYRMTANKFTDTKGAGTYRRELQRFKQEKYNLFILGRNGEKYYKDNCEAIMRRSKEGLAANEVWVGDERTLDVIVRWSDGTKLRPKVTQLQDVRSNKIISYVLENFANSDAIATGLRNGILNCSAPGGIYFDNGKDYICKFLTDEVTGFLANIGITREDTHNAIVRNARAKQIERCFKECAQNFDKAFSTYIGSNSVKRPECEKLAEKQERIIEEAEFRKLYDEFVLWYNNRESWGEGMNGRTPNEVWKAEFRRTPRMFNDADLAFLMLRSEGERVIQRGEVLFNNTIYTAKELFLLNGRKVIIKRDLFDLTKLALYAVDTKELLTIVTPYEKFHHFNESESERIGETIRGRRKYMNELSADLKAKQKGNESMSGCFDRAIITENVDMTKLKDATVKDLDAKVVEMAGTGIMAARKEYEKKEQAAEIERKETAESVREYLGGGELGEYAEKVDELEEARKYLLG